MMPILMYQVPGEGGLGYLIIGWFMYLSLPALVIAFGIFAISAYERRKMLALANGLLILVGLGIVAFDFYKSLEYQRISDHAREKSILEAKKRGDKFREVKVSEDELAGKELGEYVRKKYGVTESDSGDNQPANSTAGQ